MKAFVLTVSLVLTPAVAFAADPLAECLQTCETIIKACTDACAKKAKGQAAQCKPQCTSIADQCKKDCKDEAGGKAPKEGAQ